MKYHLCVTLEEAIENAKELRGCLRDKDGKVLYTVKEVRSFLRAELARGRKYLPYGECNNFDEDSGCKGHPAGHRCLYCGDTIPEGRQLCPNCEERLKRR